jgi:RNA:NAD 2'-phosphotransferase (TPT1/KptA family)
MLKVSGLHRTTQGYANINEMIKIFSQAGHQREKEVKEGYG